MLLLVNSVHAVIHSNMYDRVTLFQTTAVYMGEEDTVRQRGHLPAFLKESPTDPEFTKKVKRAANTIDKFR